MNRHIESLGSRRLLSTTIINLPNLDSRNVSWLGSGLDLSAFPNAASVKLTLTQVQRPAVNGTFDTEGFAKLDIVMAESTTVSVPGSDGPVSSTGGVGATTSFAGTDGHFDISFAPPLGQTINMNIVNAEDVAQFRTGAHVTFTNTGSLKLSSIGNESSNLKGSLAITDRVLTVNVTDAPVSTTTVKPHFHGHLSPLWQMVMPATDGALA